jgi:hypothetical protein
LPPQGILPNYSVKGAGSKQNFFTDLRKEKLARLGKNKIFFFIAGRDLGNQRGEFLLNF